LKTEKEGLYVSSLFPYILLNTMDTKCRWEDNNCEPKMMYDMEMFCIIAPIWLICYCVYLCLCTRDPGEVYAERMSERDLMAEDDEEDSEEEEDEEERRRMYTISMNVNVSNRPRWRVRDVQVTRRRMVPNT